MQKKCKSGIILLVTTLLVVLLTSCSSNADKSSIYVAWSDSQESYSFRSTLATIEETGAKPVVLDQAQSFDLNYDGNGNLTDSEDEHGILTSESAKKVKVNTWQNSNVSKMMEGVTCVVFPGGKDISPTLYYNEQGWHGIDDDTDYSAERDVSDYILLSYCLDNDIPVLNICRGMQMLCVVSGAEMTQDISMWYQEQGIEYDQTHRDPAKKLFKSHSVSVLSHDCLLYKIMGTNFINKVPSWHHQAIRNVDNTRLVVTAQTETNGIQLIEAVERPDKTFCIGVQYHPEVAVKKHLDKEEDAGSFMGYDEAMALFNALLEASRKY